MTYARLNLIIRVTLVVALAAVLLLSIIAARPGYRYLGEYTAVLEAPQPITAEWDEPAAFVAVSHPAVVTFPPEWAIPDQICMVVRMERGSAPTAIEFPVFPPQIEWDNRPGETVLFTMDDILGRDREGGGVLKTTNLLVAEHISSYLPFRVNWFGETTVALHEGEPVGGLLCYSFLVRLDTRPVMRIPFDHLLSFRVKNVNIMRRPAYYFAYNKPEDEPRPARTYTLYPVDISTYLARLAAEVPSAVWPMTTEQFAQRQRELMQSERSN